MDLLMVALFVIQIVLLCWIASEVAKLRPEVLLSAQAKVQAPSRQVALLLPIRANLRKNLSESNR